MKIFKKEREVAELAHRYLEAAQRCVEEAEKAVIGYLEGSTEGMRERASEVNRLERTVDGLHREMRDKLFSGAYLPLLRGDLFGLFESLDRVPNAAEACSRFFYGEQPAVPEEFREPFVAVARASFGVMVPLHKSVTGFFQEKDKVDSIRQGAKEIGQGESKVDEMELDLIVTIFDSSLELAHKNLLRRALGKIVEISDRAENTADKLLLIAMKTIA